MRRNRGRSARRLSTLERVRSTHRVAAPGSEFAGFRFPPEVITLAVRWYVRYSLSYRDVEELLAERGIEVDHTTLFRWVMRFTPLSTEAARPCRHTPGDMWCVDETSRGAHVHGAYRASLIDKGYTGPPPAGGNLRFSSSSMRSSEMGLRR